MEDKRPDWLQAYEVGTGVVNWGGVDIPYTICDREMAPELPGFLGYHNGEHLFISEEVPEGYRQFVLTHEIIEFRELRGQTGCCRMALEQELGLVPDDIKQEYIGWRRDFFRRLVDYYRARPKMGSDDFRREIAGSLTALEAITG